MRKYGLVKVLFWQDHKIRCLSIGALVVFNYLLTVQHGNALGCFRLPLRYAEEDLAPWLSPEQVTDAFSELEAAEMILYCRKSGYVLVKNFLRHNPPANQNVGKFCMTLFREIAAMIGHLPIFDELIMTIVRERPKHLTRYIKDLETISERFKNGPETPYHDHDYDHDHDHDHEPSGGGTDDERDEPDDGDQNEDDDLFGED